MRRKRILFTGMWMMVLLLGVCFYPGQVQASAVEAEEQGADPKQVQFRFDCFPGIEFNEYQMPQNDADRVCSLYYSCTNRTDGDLELTITSTNEKVFKIQSGANRTVKKGFSGIGEFSIRLEGVGAAEIVVLLGNQSFRTPIYVEPNQTKLVRVQQTAYQYVTIEWERIPGCSGYLLERRKSDEPDSQTVVAVLDADTTSKSLKATWDLSYEYRVTGFVKGIAEEKRYLGKSSEWKECTIHKKGAAITSVKSSGNKLSLKWKKMKNAVGYKLYRSDRENGKYKCIYTASKNQDSFSQKIDRGTTYYYKLVTVFPGGNSDDSPVVAKMIPMAKSAKAKVTSGNGISTFNLAYYSAGADYTYYYRAGGKLHLVCVQRNKSLNIYTLTSKMKVAKTKKIKLSYDRWGGFCQGTDGNFYVVVGYDNPKESKSKTVVKVHKYNSKWSYVKTANIKGSAYNVFPGIVSPFSGGNCQMDQKGSTLYIVTARHMFETSDGLNHQSNISFRINTKTMKASMANGSYVSHSYNQYVKFKDDSLYIFDHGDGYPRALCVTVIDHYGKVNEDDKGTSSIFQFQGSIKNNYTGCTAGGMEIGTKNILVCGRAKPHKYKIKGVTGYSSNLADNIFITLTNRKTRKSTVKWLTNYNPKTTSVEVGYPRMVKLSDERFAVLFTTKQKDKTVLHYQVVDDTGKKIYSTTYKNMLFPSSSQPIVSNGYLVWVATEEWYEWGINGLIIKTNPKIYRIPAKY